MVAPLPDDEAPRGLQLDLLAALLWLRGAAADVELADPFLGQPVIKSLICLSIDRLTPHLNAHTWGWAAVRGYLSPRPETET